MTVSTHSWVVIAEQSVPGEKVRQQIEWCRECGALKSGGILELPAACRSNPRAEIVDPRPWGEICPH